MILKRLIKFMLQSFYFRLSSLYFYDAKLSTYFKRLRWQIMQTQFKYTGKKTRIDYPIKEFHGQKYISIGDNFVSHTGLWLAVYNENDYPEPEIIIGNNVCINYDCQITAINKIIIGNNVLMANRVFISDHSHGDINSEALKLPPLVRPLVSKGPVIIGDNVWIGVGVVIMPDVTIGNNCVIGANAVVTKSFSDNCILAGVPAKIIKKF